MRNYTTDSHNTSTQLRPPTSNSLHSMVVASYVVDDNMNINIEVIPESEMRPEVNGADWFWDKDGNLQVRVSPMSDWRREILLAIHETVEAIMCKHNGVTQQSVDAFDLEYDKTHTFDVNAGDDPAAPYVREHCLATAIERILCAELDVNWLSYDQELANSYPGPSKKVVHVA